MSPCTKNLLVQSSHLQLNIRHCFFRGVLVYPVPASRFREVSAALLCFDELHRISFIVNFNFIRNANASFASYVFPCYLIRLFHIFRDFLYFPPDLSCLIFMHIIREDIFSCNFLGCMPFFLSIPTNPLGSSSQQPKPISNEFIQSDHGATRIYPRGGAFRHEFHFDTIEQYLLPGCDVTKDNAFLFVDHVDSTGRLSYPVDNHFVHASIPLEKLVSFLPVKMLLKIAKLHHIAVGSHVPKSEIIRSFENHSCASCNLYHSVFSVVGSQSLKARNRMRSLRLNKSSLQSDASESHKLETPLINLKPMRSDGPTRIRKPEPLATDNKLKTLERKAEVLFPLDPMLQPLEYPPPPLNDTQSRKIIGDFCAKSNKTSI